MIAAMNTADRYAAWDEKITFHRGLCLAELIKLEEARAFPKAHATKLPLEVDVFT
jgi:hypothetical protein